MSAHYEVERKYLIRYPALPVPGEVSCEPIEQVYLKTPRDISERVRERAGRYYHTVKLRVSGARAEEREEEITRADYLGYLERRDPACAVIRKVRRVFLYEGQTFELDTYPFWNDRAVLEIELSDESDQVVLPPFLQIIREVTDDARYKNHSIAQAIPVE